jgi:purine-binding chemotaxis protein CheW
MAMSLELDDRTARVLRERAERLARDVTREKRSGDEIEIAICSVGDETFGFPVRHLQEIVTLPAVTRLPFAPEWILGVSQVRGTLLSVIDLARLSGVKGKGKPAYLAVLEAAEGPIAFTVDQVVAYRRVSLAELSAGEAGVRSEGRSTLGVTRDLIVVLDIPRLLQQPELVIA